MKELFAVQVDAARKMFVYKVLDELDKNHKVNNQPDDSIGEGHIYMKNLIVHTVQLKL